MSDASVVTCETETPGGFAQRLQVRTHTFRADGSVALGSNDTAPGAHDYFDSALAACKALTAVWYARHKGMPLETVDVRIERDDRDERAGVYRLNVKVAFHGPLSHEEQKLLHAAVAHCPVHKLMTTTEVVIHTEELAPGA